MYNLVIIDDNDDFCQVMQCLLSNSFNISTFTDTISFFQKIESEEHYDLVLVDFSIIPNKNMKINNGCELIAYLKKHLENPPILVLFTGWITRNPLEEGKQICSCADGFLAKDSGIEQILEEINRLLVSRTF